MYIQYLFLLSPVAHQSSYNVAMVVEVPLVAALPNSVVHSRMLKPFRYQTAGTIMAGKLAKDRGWAINIGESLSLKFASCGSCGSCGTSF